MQKTSEAFNNEMENSLQKLKCVEGKEEAGIGKTNSLQDGLILVIFPS